MVVAAGKGGTAHSYPNTESRATGGEHLIADLLQTNE